MDVSPSYLIWMPYDCWRKGWWLLWTCTGMQTRIHQMCAHTHTHYDLALSFFLSLYMYISIYKLKYSQFSISTISFNICVYEYICMHVCDNIYTYIYKHTHVHNILTSGKKTSSAASQVWRREKLSSVPWSKEHHSSIEWADTDSGVSFSLRPSPHFGLLCYQGRGFHRCQTPRPSSILQKVKHEEWLCHCCFLALGYDSFICLSWMPWKNSGVDWNLLTKLQEVSELLMVTSLCLAMVPISRDYIKVRYATTPVRYTCEVRLEGPLLVHESIE
jgi:hypothetical protein